MRKKSYSLNDLEIPNLEAIPIKLRRIGMRESLKDITRYVRTIVPDSRRRGKGKLKRSFRYRVLNKGLVGQITSSAPHAHLVHDGTRPHWIRARRGRLLVVPIAGRLMVTRAVHHPGARGNPFLDKALEHEGPVVERILNEAAKPAIEESV